MDINPYIMFSGNCEEAINFYKEALGGEIRQLSRYGDAPMPIPDDYKKKIMHVSLYLENAMFMASDAHPDAPVPRESNIHLSLNTGNVDDQEKKFNKLAEGGKVTMPLQDTFWGARFGMLTDKFGVNWMLNCEIKQAVKGGVKQEASGVASSN